MSPIDSQYASNLISCTLKKEHKFVAQHLQSKLLDNLKDTYLTVQPHRDSEKRVPVPVSESTNQDVWLKYQKREPPAETGKMFNKRKASLVSENPPFDANLKSLKNK